MTTTLTTTDVPISAVSAHAYTVPTDEPESDGTLAWDSTTLIIVTVRAGGTDRPGLDLWPRSSTAAHRQ